MFTFAACDDDTLDALDMEGEWTGNMGMYYSDGYYRYDAAYTVIRFIPDYDFATHGEGEEIDYFYSPCPIRYQSFRFFWRVKDHTITMEFPYNAQLNCVIYDYKLTSREFYGVIDGTPFSLRKLSDYDDWGLYGDDDYGYGTYFRAPTRAQGAAAEVHPETFVFGRDFTAR